MSISIDRFHEILEELSQEIPQDFYRKLHGGIALLAEAKHHPETEASKDLYILGEYTRSRMGNYIKIYYGSFMEVYGHLKEEDLTEKLMDTLVHEFQHHLEGLAGSRDLEIEDARRLEEYRNRKKNL